MTPTTATTERSYCHRCQRTTETVFLPLSSGHIGNCCGQCRATRRGKPYVSKREYEARKAPTAARPEGEYEHAKK